MTWQDCVGRQLDFNSLCYTMPLFVPFMHLQTDNIEVLCWFQEWFFLIWDIVRPTAQYKGSWVTVRELTLVLSTEKFSLHMQTAIN